MRVREERRWPHLPSGGSSALPPARLRSPPLWQPLPLRNEILLRCLRQFQSIFYLSGAYTSSQRVEALPSKKRSRKKLLLTFIFPKLSQCEHFKFFYGKVASSLSSFSFSPISNPVVFNTFLEPENMCFYIFFFFFKIKVTVQESD